MNNEEKLRVHCDGCSDCGKGSCHIMHGHYRKIVYYHCGNQKLSHEDILERLGKDYDITECQVCGESIVVRDSEMEYPICNTTQCVGAFLASNY